MGGDVYQIEQRALPKRNVFINREGVARRGRGGREQEEWIDGLHGDVREFGIAGDWKTTALDKGIRVETATERGRRFVAGNDT